MALLLIAIVLLMGRRAHADEAALLAKAEVIAKRMRDAGKAGDVDALAMDIGPLVVVHNTLQDPKLRKSLQFRLGTLARTPELSALFTRAVEALLRLNDARGAYRQLQPLMPTKGAESISDDTRVVLKALAANPSEAAVSRLLAVAEYGKHAPVRAAAVGTLGHYKASPRRGEILGVILAELKERSPHAKSPLRGTWVAEWQLQRPVMVGALSRLTGTEIDDPAAWLARYAEKPRDLGSILDGSRPVRPIERTGTTRLWRALRAGLGAPKRRVKTAVDQGLAWLAAHQSSDGAWAAAEFGHWCHGKPQPGGVSDGPGRAIYDVGVAGLALTAFLVAGYDGTGSHEFDRTVRKGLARLIASQDKDGCFGLRTSSPVAQLRGVRLEAVVVPRSGGRRPLIRPLKPVVESDKNRASYVYNHATAALALVEAAASTGDQKFRHAAQRGLDFIALSRNPYFAWRYGIKPGENDTSVTTWNMLALGTAHLVNAGELRAMRPSMFTIDLSALEGARAWLEKITDPDYGRAGYLFRGTGPTRAVELMDRFPGAKTESTTAGGAWIRMLTGEDPHKSEIVKLGCDLLCKLPPTWNSTDGSIDMVYWHLGTLATHCAGGRHWKLWEKAYIGTLVKNQRQDGDICKELGSWDPIGAWGRAGGRVYATAISVLTLLTPHRFPSWTK